MRLFKRWSIATAAGPWPSMPWPHQRSNSVERLLFVSLSPSQRVVGLSCRRSLPTRGADIHAECSARVNGWSV